MSDNDFSRIEHLTEQIASQHSHQFITLEHLLLGLCQDDDSVQTLKACGVDIARLTVALEQYLAAFVPVAEVDKPTPSKAYLRLIAQLVLYVQDSGQNLLPKHALVEIIKEERSYASKLLRGHGVTLLSLRRQISAHKRQTDNPFATVSENSDDGILAKYTKNLNKIAKQGGIDPLIGRATEIERTAQILSRRRKNNPILVGDPGVGKTAVAEGLAWLIVNDKAPAMLACATIYALDMAALIAGTKFRGDFEDRIKQLLDELTKLPEAILFIDEIHTIIGAGSSMDSTLDVSNLIKPALARGQIRCIGSTTFVEYRQIFEKDHALSRRFQKIDITEPTTAQAVAILQGLKEHYEQFHQVCYTDDAITAAVELSVKHLHERFLPDKAIDILDEAGAFVRLRDGLANNSTNAKQANNTTQQPNPVIIDEKIITQVVAKMARIAPSLVNQNEKYILKNLYDNLTKSIFGQDEAARRLSDAILLARAGLNRPDKPIAAFLFAGPTGVGKTEISKQLAQLLGLPLVRFDMSEYMEAHTASRLIGAPPGYVGHDKGGLLTEKIQQNPYCVLLLDELEKAHSDVFNLLLQVMDHGTLTDNNGRAVSFRQTIIIMTTNVGADSLSRNPMGFTKSSHHHDNQEAIRRAFSPEFRNRLDGVVHFAALNRQVIGCIVDKFINQLQDLLADKKIQLSISDEVRDYLGQKGYDETMGARPMARLIEQEIKKPLAKLILFDDLAEGGVVQATLSSGAVVLQIMPSEDSGRAKLTGKKRTN